MKTEQLRYWVLVPGWVARLCYRLGFIIMTQPTPPHNSDMTWTAYVSNKSK